ncbi:MAG: 30S ribosomal protein S16 [Bacteroidia bacterium]
MSLKIRLQRQGKKKQPFYHIVVADSRSPRDGKYIERLGTYNPKHDHEGVNIDSARTLEWLEKGALPSDTCRQILTVEGIMYKKHLQRGVKKGLFNQEQADTQYAKWVAEKAKQHSDIKEKKVTSAKEAYKARVASETAAREAKAKAIAAKKAAAAEAAAPAAEAQPEQAAPNA